jgi:FkbM family methyltransferase
MARLGRFLSNEARLDVLNDEHNGERIVQSVVPRLGEGLRPIVVFDVGANVGGWSRSLVSVLRLAANPFHVYAFEPCRPTHDLLVKNLAQWGIAADVTTVGVALSDAPGAARFHSIGPGMGRNSLYALTSRPRRSNRSSATRSMGSARASAWTRLR